MLSVRDVMPILDNWFDQDQVTHTHSLSSPLLQPVQSLNDNDGLLASLHSRTGRRLIIFILSPASQPARQAGRES